MGYTSDPGRCSRRGAHIHLCTDTTHACVHMCLHGYIHSLSPTAQHQVTASQKSGLPALLLPTGRALSRVGLLWAIVRDHRCVQGGREVLTLNVHKGHTSDYLGQMTSWGQPFRLKLHRGLSFPTSLDMSLGPGHPSPCQGPDTPWPSMSPSTVVSTLLAWPFPPKTPAVSPLAWKPIHLQFPNSSGPTPKEGLLSRGHPRSDAWNQLCSPPRDSGGHLGWLSPSPLAPHSPGAKARAGPGGYGCRGLTLGAHGLKHSCAQVRQVGNAMAGKGSFHPF